MSDFENSLKEIFDDAELKPSDKVWAGVSADIQPKKKKGLFFYWQTYGVAAGLALLLALGFLLSEGERTVENNPQANKDNKESVVGKNSGEKQDSISNKNGNNTDRPVQKEVTITGLKFLANAEEDSRKQELNDSKNSAYTERTEVDLNRNADQLISFTNPSLNAPQQSIHILKSIWEMKYMVAKMDLPQYDKGDLSVPAQKGVLLNGGLSAANFNPNFSSNSNALSINDLNQNDVVINSISNSDNRELSSISFGGGLTMALNNRWGINTGVRYSEYKFGNESNAYSVENGISLPIYLPTGFSGEVKFVDVYQMTNTLRSIGIPIQGTFKVISLNKFNVEMRAGLSVDYFIDYSIRGELPFLQERKVDFKQSDLFNRFNLAGISGLAFNYKLSDQWGIAAEAYYRQFLSPDQGDGERSSPSVLGFGFNLNYLIQRNEK